MRRQIVLGLLIILLGIPASAVEVRVGLRSPVKAKLMYIPDEDQWELHGIGFMLGVLVESSVRVPNALSLNTAGSIGLQLGVESEDLTMIGSGNISRRLNIRVGIKGSLHLLEKLYWSQGLVFAIDIEQIAMIMVTGALGTWVGFSDSFVVPIELVVQYGFPFDTLVIECGVSIGIDYLRLW